MSSGEDYRNWPPPDPEGTTRAFQTPGRALAGPPEPQPKTWIVSLGWFICLAFLLTATWFVDWRWLVTSAVALFASGAIQAVELEHRKRRQGRQ